jgi:hypothetical protein
MNERIQKLAEQALKHPDNDNDGLTVFDNDELKKFAELIVAECTGVLFDESERLSELSFNEDSWQSAKEYEICSDQCVDNIALIEEHFGVE